MNHNDLTRLDEIFEQAVDLPAEAWEQFLEEQCGEDTQLREAVNVRLKAYQRVGKDTEFLEPLGPNLAEPPSVGIKVRCPHCRNGIELLDEESLEQLECKHCGSHLNVLTSRDSGVERVLPESLHHFRLIEKLGTGAFGTVWRAEDTELDRMVAIKLPRKSQLSSQDEDLFLREARLAARLRHPNIVSVHEISRDETLYIVSDLIEGQSLDQWSATTKPNLCEMVKICVDIARGLEHAHLEGVIHRDLKPANILVDGQGVPHITDFGLAKREAAEITMTIDGQILGTPAYMSPEQALGKSRDVSSRSDIYSLGVVLFELVTGRLPFEGSVALLVDQVANTDVPSPRKFNKEIPLDLDTICLKCLRKDPADRYASARELADDLERFLDFKPVLARRLSRRERAARWLRKRRRLVAFNLAFAVVGVGLAVAAIGLYGTYQQQTTAALDFSTDASVPISATLRTPDGTKLQRFTIPTGDALEVRHGDYQLDLFVPGEAKRTCDMSVDGIFDGRVAQIQLNPLGNNVWNPIPITSADMFFPLSDSHVVIWSRGENTEIRCVRGHTGETAWTTTVPFTDRRLLTIVRLDRADVNAPADLLVVGAPYQVDSSSGSSKFWMALLSGQNGETLWSKDELFLLQHDFLLSDRLAVLATGNKIVVSTGHTVDVYDRATGAAVWTRQFWEDQQDEAGKIHQYTFPVSFLDTLTLDEKPTLVVASRWATSKQRISLIDPQTGDNRSERWASHRKIVGVLGTSLENAVFVQQVASYKLVVHALSGDGQAVWEVDADSRLVAKVIADFDEDGLLDLHVYRHGDIGSKDTFLDIYSGRDGRQLSSTFLPDTRVDDAARIPSSNRIALDCSDEVLVTDVQGDVIQRFKRSAQDSLSNVGYLNADMNEDLLWRSRSMIQTTRGESKSVWRRIVADEARLVGDVNGDGHSDLLLTDCEGGHRIYRLYPARISIVSGFDSSLLWKKSMEDVGSITRCHDLSGDGIADFIVAILGKHSAKDEHAAKLAQLSAISGATGETIWSRPTLTSVSKQGNDQVADAMISVSISTDESRRDVLIGWRRLTVTGSGRTMSSTPMISRLAATDGAEIWRTPCEANTHMRVTGNLVCCVGSERLELLDQASYATMDVLDYASGNSLLSRDRDMSREKLLSPVHKRFRFTGYRLEADRSYELYRLSTGQYTSDDHLKTWSATFAVDPEDGTTIDVGSWSTLPNLRFGPIYFLLYGLPRDRDRYITMKQYPALISRGTLFELRRESETFALYAVDLQTGKTNWSIDVTDFEVAMVRGEQSDTPVLSDGSSIWGLDPLTGATVWSSSKPMARFVGIASAGNDPRLIFQSGSEAFCQQADRVK